MARRRVLAKKAARPPPSRPRRAPLRKRAPVGLRRTPRPSAPQHPHELLSPVFHQVSWIPKCLQHTATVRVTDRSQINFTTAAGDVNTLLFGVWESTAAPGNLVPNLLGVRGVNATLGTTGVNMDANLMTTAPPGRCRLNRYGVTLTCNGPTAAGALLPTSTVRIGAIKSVLDPSFFPTYADISGTLQTKTELKSTTAYALMTRPMHVTSYPLDIHDWESMKPRQWHLDQHFAR